MHIFVLNSIGAFVLLLAKLGIMLATCTAAVYWLRVSDALLDLSFLVADILCIMHRNQPVVPEE